MSPHAFAQLAQRLHSLEVATGLSFTYTMLTVLFLLATKRNKSDAR